MQKGPAASKLLTKDSFAGIILLVIVVAVLAAGGAFYLGRQSISPKGGTTTSSPTPKSNSLSNNTEMCADAGTKSGTPFVNKPFDRESFLEGGKTYYSAQGVASVKGEIVTASFDWFNNEVRKGVYLKVEPDKDSKDFYDQYIYEVNQGNSVNKKEADSLLFKLGELENGNFTSASDISPLAIDTIKEALDSDRTINLKLYIPVWGGFGAPPNFSFACAIEEEE